MSGAGLELGFDLLLAALALAIPGLPLALALAMVAPRLRTGIGLLIPLAPLPALALVLLSPDRFAVVLPPLLLGTELGLDPLRRVMLGSTALIWIAAAAYGRGYLARDAKRVRYDAFFLVTMGGNLGLIVALDAASFYVAFSLMTLSSYILVVFEGTARAYRAGRIYLVLSILGETSLLLGFIAASFAAESTRIAEIAASLGTAEGQDLTLALLVLGFSIKAGLFPLHAWLPLAHPAAPTPASAVLSGAMIKAGLLGLVVFLPLGEDSLPSLGMLLTAAGLFTAFYGALVGLTQDNPKTLLAYSSLSQMGLLIAGVGLGLDRPEIVAALIPALALYALHHGLAKAGLFFSVGLVDKRAGGGWLVVALAGLCCLSIAGAPLSAGALTKYALKHAGEGTESGLAALAVPLMTLSAVTTGLLLARFLFSLAAKLPEATEELAPRRAAAWLWGGFLAMVAASQLLVWGLFLQAESETVVSVLGPLGLRDALWPLLIVVAAVPVARRLLASPRLPEGDWVALLPSMEAADRLWKRLYDAGARRLRHRSDFWDRSFLPLLAPLERVEDLLSRPALGLAVVVGLGLLLTLGFGGG